MRERTEAKSGGRGAGGDKGDRGEGKDDERGGGRAFGRRKVCRYCADKNAKVDFKDQPALK